MNKLLKQVFLVCVCLFALIGQALADALSEAARTDLAEDHAKAAKLYRPLAKQGNSVAQYSLGFLYERGKGVPQNYKEAARWYRLAADQGDVNAQWSLGGMYRFGHGIQQDYKEAVKWYRLAADQGDAEAQCSLGEMYFAGHGVTKDYAEAERWIRQAAEHGSAKAQYNLGERYFNAANITKVSSKQIDPQEYKEAVRWYRLAAEQGYADAYLRLWYLYRYGLGVPQDYVLAHMWANIAATNADGRKKQAIAAELRNKMEKSMTADQIAKAQELAIRCTANKFIGC